ncbi:MAG: hypothetical protein LAQ30_31165 [Acidobacteriia bacterium]|nr:hypothetical protein [Terriglobia bacterium]
MVEEAEHGIEQFGICCCVCGRSRRMSIGRIDRVVSASEAGRFAPGQALVARALEFAAPLYAGQALSTGEPTTRR